MKVCYLHPKVTSLVRTKIFQKYFKSFKNRSKEFKSFKNISNVPQQSYSGIKLSQDYAS